MKIENKLRQRGSVSQFFKGLIKVTRLGSLIFLKKEQDKIQITNIRNRKGMSLQILQIKDQRYCEQLYADRLKKFR